jgi:CRISPR/Cas system-associated exonuclease Cas4 (RecB family)
MRLTQWSPSRLFLYETCHLRAKFKHVDKLPEKPNEYASRGIEIHGQAERYIKGIDNEISWDLVQVKPKLDYLRKLYALDLVDTEVSIPLKRDWTLGASWRDDPEVWVRMQIDVLEVSADKKEADVIDWKTGKYHPDNQQYKDQLALYCVATLCAIPWIEKVTSQLCFIDHGKVVKKPEGVLHRKDLQAAKDYWENRTLPMLTDEKFEPKPGGHCKYCPYTRKRGGPCEF